MQKSRLALLIIIIVLLLVGGWVYADNAKQQAVDDAVSEALRDNAMLLEMLGLEIQYANLDTSVFSNAVTFQEVSITRRLASAGVSGAQKTTIDALTIDQNLPLFEMEDAVDEARIPTEFSLQVAGLNLDSALEAMQHDTQLSPMFKHILETAVAQRQQDASLKSDMQFAYELEPGQRGERDQLQIDASVALREMGEIQWQSEFQDVNTQLFALLNLANTAQLEQLNLQYNGNASLNKAVMVKLAREAGNDVESYDQVAEQLITDLAPAGRDPESWESRELRPAVEAFIKNPQGLSLQVTPASPMTLNDLMLAYQTGNKTVLEGMTLEAH